VPLFLWSAVAPCSVAFHVAEEQGARRCEFVSDESQAEHPAAECVGVVFSLLGLGACVFELLGKLAHRKAKLDVCLQFPGVQPAFPAAAFLCELEFAELDGPLGKGRMVVQAVMCS